MIYRHISLDNADEKTIEESISQYKNKNQCLVGSVVHEAHKWEKVEVRQFKPFVNIANDYGFKNSIGVVNNTYLDKKHRIDCLPIVPVEFFALNTVYRVNDLKIETNKSWNQGSDKILFLTGKADKLNRVGLLYCLIKQGLEKNLEWSYYPFLGTDIEHQALTYFRLFNKKSSYFKWAKQYSRNPDNIKLTANENGSHYSGFPFDTKLYSSTLFSVIAESEFTDNSCIWLTEKTWKTIVNRHPFVMAGQVNTLKRLKELGFKTFENYLEIKNYDEISNPISRIDAIVKNAEYFLHSYKKHSNEINQDIEHNYRNLIKLFKDTTEQHKMFEDQGFYSSFFADTLIK